jgi:hypothetical protein
MNQYLMSLSYFHRFRLHLCRQCFRSESVLDPDPGGQKKELKGSQKRSQKIDLLGIKIIKAK